MTAPTVPYQRTEDPLNLPLQLERIAQRDYCAVNEGYWILRDAATHLRKLAADPALLSRDRASELSQDENGERVAEASAKAEE